MRIKISFLFFFFFVIVHSQAACPEKTGNEVIDRFISDMQFSYGICVEVLSPSPTTWGSSVISFDALEESDYPELEKYVRLFRAEFFKYPKSFIDSTNLKKVALVKNLKNQNIAVAAMPDYYQENLYMDIFVGNYDSTYQKHVVHHEFYHMIEEEFNGNTYYKDPEWAKMNNDSDFQYGSGGINTRSSGAGVVNHPRNGFVNEYAMSALEEDKAEIFGVLMTSEEEMIVRGWAESDKILKSKIKYLSDFLNYYSLNLD